MTSRNKNKRHEIAKNKKAENNLVKINDIVSDENNLIDYKPGVPVLKNQDKIESAVKALEDRNKNLIITKENLNLYTGRGNSLSNFRKFLKGLENKKTQVHREAKIAYTPFDEQINSYVKRITPLIDNISKQVDKFQEDEKKKKIDETEKIFNDIVLDFKKNNANKEYPNNVLDFQQWFTNSMLRISQKALKRNISEYVEEQTKEYNKYISLINKTSDNKALLFKLFKDEYSGDASEAFFKAQDKVQEIAEYNKIEEEKRKREEERLRKQKEEIERAKEELKKQREKNKLEVQNNNDQNNNNFNDSNNNETVVENKVEQIENVIYFFAINNSADAKKLKEFMDSENIKYKFKRQVK